MLIAILSFLGGMYYSSHTAPAASAQPTLQTVAGTVQSFDGKALVLYSTTGAVQTYPLDAGTPVVELYPVPVQTKSLRDLVAGAQVTITISDGKAEAVQLVASTTPQH